MRDSLSPVARLSLALAAAAFAGPFALLGVALLSTLLCLSAAHAVATEEFRRRRALELFLLSPLIVPEIAVGWVCL